MENLRLSFYVFCIFVVTISVGCQKEDFSREDLPITHTEPKGRGIDGEEHAHHPDTRTVPYPNIIHRTYIPTNPNFAHTKCKAWRITWPVYNSSISEDKIASVFSVNNGALNSIVYLNNVSKENTFNTHFSLYYQKTLKPSYSMWNELIHTFGNSSQMGIISFAKEDFTLKHIENMVKERPSLFESYWSGSPETETEYEEGDFYLYRLAKQNQVTLYGGVRIVSMKPRIIEVYLAVPNY
jgi:hypothetical protein